MRYRVALGAAVVALAVLAGCTSAESDLGEPVPSFSMAYFASDFSPTYEAGARVLADEFGKLGLDIELTPVQFSTFVERIRVGGNLEDMALGSLGGDPDRNSDLEKIPYNIEQAHQSATAGTRRGGCTSRSRRPGPRKRIEPTHAHQRQRIGT